jgi:hypothetical protein
MDEATVAGVPTGTAKADVSMTTDLSVQTKPAVDSDPAAADSPSALACCVVLANEAARADDCAASTTAVRANHKRPPATRRPRKITRAGTSKVISTDAAPRSPTGR